MNNNEVNLTNDAYSLHRILRTDIKKVPNLEEDEIISSSSKLGTFLISVLNILCNE